MFFEELKLQNNLLDALYDMNFKECTPIQEQSIPQLLNGYDLMGIAQTGTGKTAAYLLPLLNQLCSGNYIEGKVNCLIMAPTRELVMQIDQAIDGFSYYIPVSSVAVYGGNDGIRYEQELRGIKTGADIIVATPGRLISHLSLGNLDLSKISFFVLDEADRMLDMGFYDDIMKIVSYLPQKRQTIMFSATMPSEINKMASTILHNPVKIEIAIAKPAEGILQSAYICFESQKSKILESILTRVTRTIIFASSKQKVKDLSIYLKRKGFNVNQMHSDLSQEERNHTMLNFKAGNIDILVATDIISRGIDIDDINMVINYDVPKDVEDYVHRVGRTARCGKQGRAITLVNEKDQRFFSKIEKVTKCHIIHEEIPDSLGEIPQYKPFKDIQKKKKYHWHNKRNKSNSKKQKI